MSRDERVYGSAVGVCSMSECVVGCETLVKSECLLQQLAQLGMALSNLFHLSAGGHTSQM